MTTAGVSDVPRRAHGHGDLPLTELNDPGGPWTSHLEAMEHAIAHAQFGSALRAWRHASRAALRQPGWQPLLTVARASRRIGALPGLDRAAATRARDLCWAALVRAHLQATPDGVRAAAATFASLGDWAMAEQCLRLIGRSG